MNVARQFNPWKVDYFRENLINPRAECSTIIETYCSPEYLAAVTLQETEHTITYQVSGFVLQNRHHPDHLYSNEDIVFFTLQEFSKNKAREEASQKTREIRSFIDLNYFR